MRGLTTQSAESIRFLLNGRDGGADRMVSVVDYFRSQSRPYVHLVMELTNNSAVQCQRALSSPAVCSVRAEELRAVSHSLELGQIGPLCRRLEFVQLVEFNRIPMVRLTGDQQADMIRVAAKKPRERLAQSLSIASHANSLLTRSQSSSGVRRSIGRTCHRSKLGASRSTKT